MADTPPFGIQFKKPSNDERTVAATARVREDKAGGVQRHDRVPVYQQALDFAALAFQVLEAAQAERYYLRDQLDRKSAIIPQLVAQGLATADMNLRRALYTRARQTLTDCAAILDILSERRIVAQDVLTPARGLALALLDELLALTVPPPRAW